MSALVEEVKRAYSLSLSPEYVERVKAVQPSVTAQELYRRALSENLTEVCERGGLPYGIASQTSAVLPTSVVLQINSARDTTQPLHPCADINGDTMDVMSMAGVTQRNSPNRLLRLVLTDGFDDLPAVELRTLRVFREIPVPGEKLLIKAGAEVRHGILILSEEDVVCLGGEVAQLKQEFAALRRRTAGAARCDTSLPGGSSGLDGVPRFAPLQVSSCSTSPQGGGPATQSGISPAVQMVRGRGGAGVQQHRGGGRGQRGGRSRGRTNERAGGRTRGGVPQANTGQMRNTRYGQPAHWRSDCHGGRVHYDPSTTFARADVDSNPPALNNINYPSLAAAYHST